MSKASEVHVPKKRGRPAGSKNKTAKTEVVMEAVKPVQTAKFIRPILVSEIQYGFITAISEASGFSRSEVLEAVIHEFILKAHTK